MLIIIPTPIGNLKDITLRALETLREVDGIICEDSRRTSLLLNHYQINSGKTGVKKPMMVLNDFNEGREIHRFMEKLKGGQNLALVSDAGTPLISDPGYKLVRECLTRGIEVDSLPGPSSVTTALTLSGLPPDKFLFLGYLPEKSGQREKLLKKLPVINENLKLTFIIFVSPYKLLRTLEDMKNIFGDIEITLARELTKIHQSVKSDRVSYWANQFSTPPKGEFVILFTLP